MKIAVVWDTDPSLGTDPKDTADPPDPRAQGTWIDSDKLDCILIWRTMGEQYEDGARIHVVSGGAWENITPEQTEEIIAWLTDRGLGDDEGG